MQTVSAQFELNRKSPINYLTKKIELDYENLALPELGASITSYGDYSNKFPASAIINGDITHVNAGLDVLDAGFDPLFTAKNVWKGAFSSWGHLYIPSSLPGVDGWTVTKTLALADGQCADTVISGPLLQIVLENAENPPFSPPISIYDMQRADANIRSNASGNTFEVSMTIQAGDIYVFTLDDGTTKVDVKIMSSSLWVNGSLVGTWTYTSGQNIFSMTLQGTTMTVSKNGVAVYTGTVSAGGSTAKHVGINLQTTALGGASTNYLAYAQYTGSSILSNPIITIDLGATKTISRCELYAHPYLNTNTSYLVSYSTNGTSWTDIVAYTKTQGNKVKNGAVSLAVSGAGLVTTDAQALFLYFADINARYIRILVNASDYFPSLCGVRLFQTIDITNDCISFSCTQQMTYNLKRYMVKSATLKVRNYDRTFSPDVNTNIIPNLEVRAWGGYNNENILLGRFYIDTIDVDAQTKTVQFSCRDYAKQFVNRQITTQTFSDITSEIALEYLANFCNMPSSITNLDAVASILQYWFPDNVGVWDEMQKVAEAVGLQSVFVDEMGVLQFRSKIDTYGMIDVPTPAGSSGLKIYDVVYGGGSLWFATSYNSETYTYFQRYNIATRTWTNLQVAYNAGYRFWQSKLVWCSTRQSIFCVDNALASYEWTGVILSTHANNHAVDYITTDGSSIYGFGFGTTAFHSYNMGTGVDTNEGTPTGGKGWVTYALGSVWISKTSLVERTAPSTFTSRGSFSAGDVQGGVVYSGKLFFFGSQATSFPTYQFTAYRYDPGTGIVNEHQQIFQSIGMWTNAISRTVIASDFRSWFMIESVTFGLQLCFYNHITKVFLQNGDIGNEYYFPVIGDILPTDVIIYSYMNMCWTFKGKVLYNNTPAFTFTYADDLQQLQVRQSDESGGESQLVTNAIVTSNPWSRSSASATHWKYTGQPFIVPAGTTFQMPISLDTPCDTVGMTLTLTYSPSGAGETVTLTAHPTSPIITIVAAGGDITVTAASVDAYGLIQTGNIIAKIAGSALLTKRYCNRDFTLQNDYIYINSVPKNIAQYIIDNYNKVVSWLPSLKIVFTPQIELNDVVTVIETNSGVSSNYAVISIEHEIISAKTSLVLVKV